MKPKIYTILAKVLLLLFALCIVAMLNSCTTFRKCQQLYGSNYTDTTYVTVTHRDTILADSTIYSFRNDTTFFKVIDKNNTILTIQKEPKYTYINCKTKEIVRTVTLQAPCPPVPQNWGVSPWYKTGVFVLSGGLILALICIAILFLIKRNNISIFGK